MNIDDKMLQFVERLAKDLFDVTIVNLKTNNVSDIKNFSELFNSVISGYITGMLHTLKKLSTVDKNVEQGISKFIEAFQDHLMKFDDLAYFAKYDEEGNKHDML